MQTIFRLNMLSYIQLYYSFYQSYKIHNDASRCFFLNLFAVWSFMVLIYLSCLIFILFSSCLNIFYISFKLINISPAVSSNNFRFFLISCDIICLPYIIICFRIAYCFISYLLGIWNYFSNRSFLHTRTPW